MGSIVAKNALADGSWSDETVAIASKFGLCEGEVEAFVESCEQQHRSALHVACAVGDAAAVKALLDVMEREEVDMKDERGETAFGIAFFGEKIECVELLVSCTKIGGGRLLMEPLADLMPPSALSGRRRVAHTALHTILQAGYTPELDVKRLIPLIPSRCMRVVGPDQQTLAHALCAPPVLGKDALRCHSDEKEERVRIAEVLMPLLPLQMLRATDSAGRTPLQLSVSWSLPRITELLLNRIGDVYLSDRVAGGGTALHFLGAYPSTEEKRVETATLVLKRASHKALYALDKNERSIVHVFCSKNLPDVLRLCAEAHPAFVREMLTTGAKQPLAELCNVFECRRESFEIIFGVLEDMEDSEREAILTASSAREPVCYLVFRNKTLSQDTVGFLIDKMPLRLLQKPRNYVAGSALHVILETAPPWIRSEDSLPILSSLLDKLGPECLEATPKSPPPLMLAVRAAAYHWGLAMLPVTPCASIRYRDHNGATILHKMSGACSEGALEFLVAVLEMAPPEELFVTTNVGASWLDLVLLNESLADSINQWLHLVPDQVIAKSLNVFLIVSDWMGRRGIPCDQPPVCTLLYRLFQTTQVEGQTALTEFLTELCKPGCAKEVHSALLSCIPSEAYLAVRSNGDTFLHCVVGQTQPSYGHFVELLSHVPREVLCMTNDKGLTAYDVALEVGALPERMVAMLRVPVKGAVCT